ncbi:uncharacterized protein BDV17DRAFT_287295 [Aspergillus undulatus]|uniref:uncharacterized protein n=1 Tax=Aspergillus undulatus TaxID=1810928 RepID=UPI003CCDB570
MENLNNDILLLIGDFLARHEDRHSAIFINRRFNKLFSRSLYRSATLKNRSQVQSFLKALLLRPSLSGVVRSLDFSGWKLEHNDRVLTQDDIALVSLSAKTHSHSADEHSQWEKDLAEGLDEAWIALLLSTVQNISQLNLVYPSQAPESRGYLDRLFERATTQLPSTRHPAFHRLREVSLRQANGLDGVTGTFSTSQAMPFLQMPALKSLCVDSLIEYRGPVDEQTDEQADVDEQTPVEAAPSLQSLPPPKPEVQAQSLTEITLSMSNGFNGMSELLSSCPSLKSLKYQHSDAHLLSEGFQPSAFFNSLSANKSTLRTIHLDNLGEHLPFTISGLNETHEQPFGSFADFTALKDLRIRLPNLLDMQWQLNFEPSVPLTEVLPTSIEELYIESCKENTLPVLLRQVNGLLEAKGKEKKKKFANLASLSIEGFFHDDEEDAPVSGDGNGDELNREGGRVIKPRVYEMVEPLRGACEKANVQLFLRDRASRLLDLLFPRASTMSEPRTAVYASTDAALNISIFPIQTPAKTYYAAQIPVRKPRFQGSLDPARIDFNRITSHRDIPPRGEGDKSWYTTSLGEYGSISAPLATASCSRRPKSSATRTKATDDVKAQTSTVKSAAFEQASKACNDLAGTFTDLAAVFEDDTSDISVTVTVTATAPRILGVPAGAPSLASPAVAEPSAPQKL